MTREKALATIDAPPDAELWQLAERMEESVYRHAAFFLQRPFVVKQALRKIKALEELQEAAVVLGLEENDALLDLRASNKEETISTPEKMIRDFHEEEKALKVILANTTNPVTAASALRLWCKGFNRFALQFTRKVKEAYPGLELPDYVKLTEPIDYVQVISELKKEHTAWNEVLKLCAVLHKQLISA